VAHAGTTLGSLSLTVKLGSVKKELVRAGIPMVYRPMVWLQISGAAALRAEGPNHGT